MRPLPHGALGPVLTEFAMSGARFVTIIGCYMDEGGRCHQGIPQETMHAARACRFALACESCPAELTGRVVVGLLTTGCPETTWSSDMPGPRMRLGSSLRSFRGPVLAWLIRSSGQCVVDSVGHYRSYVLCGPALWTAVPQPRQAGRHRLPRSHKRKLPRFAIARDFRQILWHTL